MTIPGDTDRCLTGQDWIGLDWIESGGWRRTADLVSWLVGFTLLVEEGREGLEGKTVRKRTGRIMHQKKAKKRGEIIRLAHKYAQVLHKSGAGWVIAPPSWRS